MRAEREKEENFIFVLEHIKWILITFETEENEKIRLRFRREKSIEVWD
jgi:hypothetical protein